MKIEGLGGQHEEIMTFPNIHTLVTGKTHAEKFNLKELN
jgi:hypothetical protein